MSKWIEIQLKQGINTVGNYTSKDIQASEAFADPGIHNAKTLVDGKWKSWDKGSPEMFNGFSVVEIGKGYVVHANQNAVFKLKKAYTADITDVPAVKGDNMLAIPTEGVAVTERNARFKASIFKKVDKTRWKSFTVGSPEAFQGFTIFEEQQGYFVKVIEVYPNKRKGTYLPDVLRYILGRDIMAEKTDVRFLDRVETGLRLSFYQRNKI